MKFKLYSDVYNLLNTENLYFGGNGRLGLSVGDCRGDLPAGVVACALSERVSGRFI